MVAEKNKEPTKTEQTAGDELVWVGVQFYSRARGTGEVISRSFPWWSPTLKFAIDQAKAQNKGNRQRRMHWTHVVVHAQLTETKDGYRHDAVELKEHKL